MPTSGTRKRQRSNSNKSTKSKSKGIIICSICREEIDKFDLTNVWCCGCKQEFHNNCLNEWIKINDSCPVCRRKSYTESQFVTKLFKNSSKTPKNKNKKLLKNLYKNKKNCRCVAKSTKNPKCGDVFNLHNNPFRDNGNDDADSMFHDNYEEREDVRVIRYDDSGNDSGNDRIDRRVMAQEPDPVEYLIND